LKNIYHEEDFWFVYFKNKKLFLSEREVKLLCPMLNSLTQSSIDRVDKVKPAPNFFNKSYVFIKHIKNIFLVFNFCKKNVDKSS